MRILSDDQQTVVILTKKEAAPLGVLLDACLDVAGNIEGRDVGLTNRQLSTAEDNMTILADCLGNGRVPT